MPRTRGDEQRTLQSRSLKPPQLHGAPSFINPFLCQVRVVARANKEWDPYLNSGASSDRSNARKDTLHKGSSISVVSSRSSLRIATHLQIVNRDLVMHVSNHQSSIRRRIGAGNVYGPALSVVPSAVHVVRPRILRGSRGRPLQREVNSSAKCHREE